MRDAVIELADQVIPPYHLTAPSRVLRRRSSIFARVKPLGATASDYFGIFLFFTIISIDSM